MLFSASIVMIFWLLSLSFSGHAQCQMLYYFFFNLFIYLFLAVMGLRCCIRAFSSCSERWLLFVVVRRLLIAVASLVAEHRLQARGLQQLWLSGFVARGMWDLPGPGLEHVSPALAGRFLTTVPPGKSDALFFIYTIFLNLKLTEKLHIQYKVPFLLELMKEIFTY